MGLFQGGPTPPGMTPLPPAAHPPILGSAASALTAQEARARARTSAGQGDSNTIFTSPQGEKLKQAGEAPATLLGS